MSTRQRLAGVMRSGKPSFRRTDSKAGPMRSTRRWWPRLPAAAVLGLWYGPAIMMRFIRLVGGGLGVILAIALAGFGGTSSGLLEPTIEGRLLLGDWIAAWFVVGYAILPYLTVEPAKRLANAVRTMSTGEFVSAVLGLLVGLLMGLLLGLPLANFPDPTAGCCRWASRWSWAWA